MFRDTLITAAVRDVALPRRVSNMQRHSLPYEKESSSRLPCSTGCPKIIVPCLFGYCGGAVDSIVSVLLICID